MKGIYKITNVKTNKIYVGSAQLIERRWRKHKESLRANRHHNIHLQSSWNKHGSETFVFEVIEEVKKDEDLLTAEQKWLDATGCYDRSIGYNICPAAGSPLGREVTPETRAKISKAIKGENHHFYGKELSDEHKAKISNSNKGKEAWNAGVKLPSLSDEHKVKISQALIGRSVSEGTKSKISHTLMGHSVSEETREKLRQANLGKKPSDETRAKISRALSGDNNHSAKLTWEKVREIRRIRKEEGLSTIKLAKMFDVSQSTVYNIVRNKTWKE